MKILRGMPSDRTNCEVQRIGRRESGRGGKGKDGERDGFQPFEACGWITATDYSLDGSIGSKNNCSTHGHH